MNKQDYIKIINEKNVKKKIPDILKDFENLEKPDGEPPKDMVDNFSELVVGEMIKNICNAVENME